MDKTFNSAKKVYRDNFLEYKLTNDPKYKIAYEGALQSMKNTITTLKSQTHGTKDIAKKIVQEKDLVTANKTITKMPFTFFIFI